MKNILKRKPKTDRLGSSIKKSDTAMPLDRRLPIRMWLVPIHVGRRTHRGHVKARTAGDARRKIQARLDERGLVGSIGKPVVKT